MHDAAQAFYDYCRSSGKGDIHQLDGEKNGIRMCGITMEITATVDRIEGEMAVLLLRGDAQVTFNLPVVFLAGIIDGDIVNITITKNAIATDETRERVMNLIEKLKSKGQ